MARAAWEEAGVADRIDLRIGPGIETLRALPPGEQFDLAFIDADKPGYPGYYEEILQRLRPGGLILLDNMLQGGRVLDADRRRRERHRDPRPERRSSRATTGCAWCCCRSATASAWCRSSDPGCARCRAPSGSRACPTANARPRRPARRRAAPCSGATCARTCVGQLVERERRAGPGLHDRDHPLAPAVVGHADDDRVEHGGVRLQRRLDLFGVHLLAAGVDRHRAPPEHGDGAVGLDAGVVAGHRPAHAVDHGERGRGLLRVLVVAERHVAAPGELADHADRHRAAGRRRARWSRRSR